MKNIKNRKFEKCKGLIVVSFFVHDGDSYFPITSEIVKCDSFLISKDEQWNLIKLNKKSLKANLKPLIDLLSEMSEECLNSTRIQLFIQRVALLKKDTNGFYNRFNDVPAKRFLDYAKKYL